MTEDENIEKLRVVSMTDAKPKSEVEKAGDSIRKDFDALCANATTVAKIRRVAYLAYVKEGFTAEQAMELCCK